MVLVRPYGGSKLLWITLCALALIHGLAVDGAVQRCPAEGICSAKELRTSVETSFYLLGYCSSAKSLECKGLTSLLEASEPLTNKTHVKTGLLVYDAEHWPIQLNVSTATQLWFACHDGEQVIMKIITNTGVAASALAATAAAAATTGCSPDVPFYACPQLSSQAKLDLLLSTLAAAVRQQGAVCIARQMLNIHRIATAAAAAAAATLLPEMPAADPLAEAFLQSMDTANQQRLQGLWPFSFVIFCLPIIVFPLVFLCVTKVVLGASPLYIEAPATALAAVVAKLCADLELCQYGWTGTSSWWWVVGASSVMWLICHSLVTWLVDLERAARARDSQAAQQWASVSKLSASTAAAAAAAAAESSRLSSGDSKQAVAEQVSSAVCKPPTPGADVQQQSTNALQPEAQKQATSAATTTAAAAALAGDSSNSEVVAHLLTASIGAAADGSPSAACREAAADSVVGTNNEATTAAAAAKCATTGSTGMSEIDGMRLDNAQLTDPFMQPHEESADINAAAAATAAAGNQGAATREHLAYLLSCSDSMECRLEDRMIGGLGADGSGDDPASLDETTLSATNDATNTKSNSSSCIDACEVSSDDWQQVEIDVEQQKI